MRYVPVLQREEEALQQPGLSALSLINSCFYNSFLSSSSPLLLLLSMHSMHFLTASPLLFAKQSLTKQVKDCFFVTFHYISSCISILSFINVIFYQLQLVSLLDCIHIPPSLIMGVQIIVNNMLRCLMCVCVCLFWVCVCGIWVFV